MTEAPEQSANLAWHHGWWRAAQHIRSPNFGARPAGAVIDLAVLHSISLPPGVYGNGAIEQLFCNVLDWQAHPYFQSLRGTRVSAHFVLTRSGLVQQFVSADARAWHAGRSQFQGRANCNDFSIGIELEGLEGECFAAAQYGSLRRLLLALCTRYPLRFIAGHEHIAPNRKIDPGPGFDWQALQALPLIICRDPNAATAPLGGP